MILTLAGIYVSGFVLLSLIMGYISRNRTPPTEQENTYALLWTIFWPFSLCWAFFVITGLVVGKWIQEW